MPRSRKLAVDIAAVMKALEGIDPEAATPEDVMMAVEEALRGPVENRRLAHSPDTDAAARRHLAKLRREGVPVRQARQLALRAAVRETLGRKVAAGSRPAAPAAKPKLAQTPADLTPRQRKIYNHYNRKTGGVFSPDKAFDLARRA